MMPEPGGQEAAEEPPAADDHGAPVDDGRRHGLDVLLAGGEGVAVLHEGSLGQQVLAPGRQAEAETEEADAEEDALELGLAARPSRGRRRRRSRPRR